MERSNKEEMKKKLSKLKKVSEKNKKLEGSIDLCIDSISTSQKRLISLGEIS